MKRYLLLLLLLSVSVQLFSQAPEGFRYNATVRNELGEPLVNKAVSFLFSIIGGRTGESVYIEKNNALTDNFGFISLVIGNGIDKIGNFENINWGGDNFYLKIEIDTTGGTSYTEMGTAQFLSVPYALYAKTAGNGFSGDYNHLFNKPVTDGSETKIAVGNNLTISGLGTISEPYLINSRLHFVGESYGGGIVFYVYDNGQHGLIASTTDQDISVEWFNGVRRYTSTSGDGLKAGEMNTFIIVSMQTIDNPVGNFAAKICADYSVTIDGVTFGDWYLPSKYELDLMFPHKNLIGGFTSDYYWTSTEFSSVSAWGQSFINGQQSNLNKSMQCGVRAIRSF